MGSPIVIMAIEGKRFKRHLIVIVIYDTAQSPVFKHYSTDGSDSPSIFRTISDMSQVFFCGCALAYLPLMYRRMQFARPQLPQSFDSSWLAKVHVRANGC